MIGGEILFFHQRQRKGGLRHIQHLGVVIFRQNGADDLIELFLGVALHIYFSHALLVQRGDEDQPAVGLAFPDLVAIQPAHIHLALQLRHHGVLIGIAAQPFLKGIVHLLAASLGALRQADDDAALFHGTAGIVEALFALPKVNILRESAAGGNDDIGPFRDGIEIEILGQFSAVQVGFQWQATAW